MDKNTLSNYGWIVIAVLVLSVMIALATPFGQYVEQGVRATTEGLFDTSKNAVNSAFADLGVQMNDQTFEEGYTAPNNKNNSDNISIYDKIKNGGAIFNKKPVDECDCMEDLEMHQCQITTEPFALTWDELQDTQNGVLYRFDASVIDNNTVGWRAFYESGFMTYIVIPNGITTIEDEAFFYAKELNTVVIPKTVTTIGGSLFYHNNSIEIIFEGTRTEWENISKSPEWNSSDSGNLQVTIHCSDDI